MNISDLVSVLKTIITVRIEEVTENSVTFQAYDYNANELICDIYATKEGDNINFNGVILKGSHSKKSIEWHINNALDNKFKGIILASVEQKPLINAVRTTRNNALRLIREGNTKNLSYYESFGKFFPIHGDGV